MQDALRATQHAGWLLEVEPPAPVLLKVLPHSFPRFARVIWSRLLSFLWIADTRKEAEIVHDVGGSYHYEQVVLGG